MAFVKSAIICLFSATLDHGLGRNQGFNGALEQLNGATALLADDTATADQKEAAYSRLSKALPLLEPLTHLAKEPKALAQQLQQPKELIRLFPTYADYTTHLQQVEQFNGALEQLNGATALLADDTATADQKEEAYTKRLAHAKTLRVLQNLAIDPALLNQKLDLILLLAELFPTHQQFQVWERRANVIVSSMEIFDGRKTDKKTTEEQVDALLDDRYEAAMKLKALNLTSDDVKPLLRDGMTPEQMLEELRRPVEFYICAHYEKDMPLLYGPLAKVALHALHTRERFVDSRALKASLLLVDATTMMLPYALPKALMIPVAAADGNGTILAQQLKGHIITSWNNAVATVKEAVATVKKDPAAAVKDSVASCKESAKRRSLRKKVDLLHSVDGLVQISSRALLLGLELVATTNPQAKKLSRHILDIASLTHAVALLGDYAHMANKLYKYTTPDCDLISLIEIFKQFSCVWA